MAGLPTEGRTAGRRRGIHIARTDIPTAHPDQPAREAAAEMAGSEIELCLVLDDRGVLLGRVDGLPEGADPDALVGEIMRLAPGTEKPETFLHDLIDGLRSTRFKRTILTGRIGEEAGRYLGVVLLEDAERTLEENERLPS